MKKKLCLVLTLMLCITMIGGSICENNLAPQAHYSCLDANGELLKGYVYPDVKATRWSADYICMLEEMQAFNGYPDGMFKPRNNMTNAEFVKTVVCLASNKNIQKGAGSSWADPYFKEAESLGITAHIDKSKYNEKATRYFMAETIVNALEKCYKSETDSKPANLTDLNTIPAEYKDSVLKAFNAGIITGYEDGSFGGSRNATREECAAMICRMVMIDNQKHLIAKAPADENELNKYMTPANAKILSDSLNKMKNYKLGETIVTYLGNTHMADGVYIVDGDYFGLRIGESAFTRGEKGIAWDFDMDMGKILTDAKSKMVGVNVNDFKYCPPYTSTIGVRYKDGTLEYGRPILDPWYREYEPDEVDYIYLSLIFATEDDAGGHNEAYLIEYVVKPNSNSYTDDSIYPYWRDVN